MPNKTVMKKKARQLKKDMVAAKKKRQASLKRVPSTKRTSSGPKTKGNTGRVSKLRTQRSRKITAR